MLDGIELDDSKFEEELQNNRYKELAVALKRLSFTIDEYESRLDKNTQGIDRSLNKIRDDITTYLKELKKIVEKKETPKDKELEKWEFTVETDLTGCIESITAEQIK